MYQELEQAIVALLSNCGIDSLAKKTILDIGCGSDYWIQEFLKLGAVPGNLVGIDLLDWRVAMLKSSDSPSRLSMLYFSSRFFFDSGSANEAQGGF